MIPSSARWVVALWQSAAEQAPKAVLLFCEAVIVVSLLWAGLRVASGTDKYLVGGMLVAVALAMRYRFQAIWPEGPILRITWARFGKSILRWVIVTTLAAGLMFAGYRLSRVAEQVQFGVKEVEGRACETSGTYMQLNQCDFYSSPAPAAPISPAARPKAKATD